LVFYLSANNIGDKAWAGLICIGLPTNSSYETFADHTVQVAGHFFGSERNEQAAIRSASETLGIKIRDLSVKTVNWI